jgi:hypothetical protein
VGLALQSTPTVSKSNRVQQKLSSPVPNFSANQTHISFWRFFFVIKHRSGGKDLKEGVKRKWKMNLDSFYSIFCKVQKKGEDLKER